MVARRRLAATGVCLAVAAAALTGCGGGHRRAIRPRPAAAIASGTKTSGPPVPSTAATAPPSSQPTPGSTTPAPAPAGRATPAPAGQATPSPAPVVVPATTLVATIGPAGAPGSPLPGAVANIHVPGSWLGAASVLPVIGQQPGWIEVRLAQRPNQSTAWVPSADVSLATNPYYVVIDLAATRLRLFQAAQQIASFPVGVGVPAAPTPPGQFFVALFARAPSAGYGAFLMVTSAHSNTISDWEASGDAIVAIHGSLGADGAIGTAGARVSHGCIRLHNADLAQLRDVPAGTPVDIVG